MKEPWYYMLESLPFQAITHIQNLGSRKRPTVWLPATSHLQGEIWPFGLNITHRKESGGRKEQFWCSTNNRKSGKVNNVKVKDTTATNFVQRKKNANQANCSLTQPAFPRPPVTGKVVWDLEVASVAPAIHFPGFADWLLSPFSEKASWELQQC